MQLLTLKLENWRGVTYREIEFAPGVTVIEGPNEIGKSTIVEALQVLFAERDSAKSKRIQAIAPVGQDVGSSVEVALVVGEQQLVYRKTYNKKPATVLSVSGAQQLQLSGREAHEWVTEFLAAQVDMDLWQALLVDQSDTLGKANLQSSQGLAQALDEAAGNSGDEGRIEDTNLYTAALAEYEKYFTLKTGKPKAAVQELEKRVAQAQQALTQAQAALQTITEDSQDHERCSAEAIRLQTELPKLEAQAAAQELAWTELGLLQEQQEIKQQELVAAQSLLQSLQQVQDTRLLLAEEIRQGATRVASEQALGAPMQRQAAGLKSQVQATRERLSRLRAELEQARARVNLASADADYHQNQTVFLDHEKRLNQLQALEVQMAAHLEITKGTNINDQVVEQFRAAETTLAVVEGQRDTAATTYALLAHTSLNAKVDGQAVVIGDGEAAKGVVGKKLVLEVPGTLSITLTPSASVADIQDALTAAEAQLVQLQQTYVVKGSGAAQTSNAQRHQAQAELDKLANLQQQLLGAKSLVELEHEVRSQRAAATRYLEQRAQELELPSSATQAQIALEQAREAQARVESELEQQRQLEDEQRTEHDAVDVKFRQVQQDLQGLAATLAEKQNRLAQDREAKSDAEVQAAVTAQQVLVTGLVAAVEQLAGAWQAANPDAIRALRDNARLVCSRATQDLATNQRRLDVLNDRLQQAQADGRFDAAEAAINTHAQLTRELQAIHRRAAAAQRLWTQLSEHRSRSRQAYVEPLKRAVEALGAIVFGAGFAVELDEDWTLVSRTLGGITLPFVALSIGAKEQLGILLRLAAGQVTARQGGVPLIIDDALGFSDPTRLATMGAAIAAAGRQAQVIILTCTPGRFTHVGNAKVVAFGK